MNYNPQYTYGQPQPVYPMPQQNNMYGYAAPKITARNTVVLTDEQIAKLRNDANVLQLKVNEEDLWKTACTHRTREGSTISICGTRIGKKGETINKYHCSICKREFEMPDYSVADVQEAVDVIFNITNSIKVLYADMPEELAANYFKFETMLSKLPSIWERGIQNFAMYEFNGQNSVNSFGPGMNGFSAINSMLGGVPYTYPQPMYGQPMYGQPPQPMYQTPQGQPMYGQPMYVQPQPMYQTPQGQPMYGQQPVYQTPQGMDPNSNPMAYGAPQPVQNPAIVQQEAQNPGIVPGTPAPAPAPTQQTGEIQQNQTFNL